MIRVALAAAAAFAFTTPALATTLNATFQGTATTNILNPVPGAQTFTLSGNFISYLASPNLPQITGGDLDRYSFEVMGLSSAFNEATRTTTYSNVTGSIFYNYGGGVRGAVQNLAPTTLTVTFDPTLSTAAILGSLVSSGPVTPAGFPGPVDFTPANGAQILGAYVSLAPQRGQVVGSIAFNDVAVPEPATWAMMIGGFGLVGASMRRRKVAVRFA